MLNELKKVWNTNKLFIIILLLAEVFLLFYVKLHNNLIALLYIIPFLFLFLNIDRKDVLMYHLSFPKSNFFLFLDKFLAVYIPFVIFLIFPLIFFPSLADVDIYRILLFVGLFIFIFLFFFSTHYSLFYILLFILTQFVNPAVEKSISNSRTSWGPDTEVLVFFFILIIILIPTFSLKYSDRIKNRFKEIITVFILFLLFLIPYRILFNTGFFGKPTDIFVNKNYVSIVKSKGSNIRYLLNEKKKLYPVYFFHSRAFLWNEKDVFYYDETTLDEDINQNITIDKTLFVYNYYGNNSNYNRILTSKEYITLSLKGYFNLPENIYFRNNGKLYKGRIETKKVTKIKIGEKHIRHYGNQYFIKFNDKSHIIFDDKGLIEVNPKYRWLLFDLDNIYYLDNDLVKNYKEEVMIKSKKTIKYIDLRTIEIENKYYTPFNDQIYEIPKNGKFLLDKIYYIKNNKVILKKIGGSIIMEFPLPQKIVKNYLLHYYNGNYYLFVYDKKPLRIYKLNKSHWEKYDTIW
ncbi:hypothetical protein J7L48_09220 [bacterium]|nr:hypothetical protein [bacterium]